MKQEQPWQGARPKKKQRGGGSFLIQNNRYAYDLVGNILKVDNQLPIIRNALGGASSYEYQYDNLNRLTLAKGNYTGELTSASYELKMSYNNLNSITKKELNHLSGGVQKGYTLDYSYNNPFHPHAPSEIMEIGKPKARTYQYDGNGNPLYYEESKSFRSMVWDEENRLRGINDNGKLHLYTYDHTGERVLKSRGESSTVVTNGLTSAVITHMDDYTAYVNPYFVVQKGRFTKHYFEGSSRIVSKLGEGTFVHKNTGIMAGGIDYIRQSAQMQEARDRYIQGSLTPPGPPTQHGIYASPEWTGQPYPSLGWQNIRQDQEPPEGWPRPPKFNEPGDVPGPPVQYGDPITPQTVKAGYGFIDNGIIEKNLYFYHPDHLGSSSYITDREGIIIQHTEYIAFGEVLFEEHSTSRTMPYLFNGKELDTETGLYYYGARYLDSKTSLWLNTDPLSGYNPIQETEHYIDGQHNNGVFNPMNHNTYGYTYNNPIIYIDPNGKQSYFDPTGVGSYIQGQLQGIGTYAQYKVSKTYNDTKQAIINTAKQAQTWVKNNKKEILSLAKNFQETGDQATIAGLGMAAAGAPVAGVGAAPGLALSTAGGISSTVGTAMEVGVELITQDFSDNKTGKAIYNIGTAYIIDKTIDALIPGPTPTKGMTSQAQKKLNEMNKVKTEIIRETSKKAVEKE